MTKKTVQQMTTAVILSNMTTNIIHGTNSDMKMYLDELVNRGVITSVNASAIMAMYKADTLNSTKEYAVQVVNKDGETLTGRATNKAEAEKQMAQYRNSPVFKKVGMVERTATPWVKVW